MTPLYWLVGVLLVAWFVERCLYHIWLADARADRKKALDGIGKQLAVLIYHIKQSNQRLESNEYYRSKERP